MHSKKDFLEILLEQNDFSSIISLISEIHYTAADFLRRRLAQQGLTDLVSSHGNILYQLSLHKKLTMKELTEKINRDKSTVTALIKKLENAGYIEREQSSSDNRVTYIRLSEEGRALTGPTSSISKELISTCYTGFSEEEKKTVYTFLRRISKNFSGLT